MSTITNFSIERTMRRLPFTLFALLGAAGACKQDATFPEPAVAKAALTWANAVSDTGQLDFRIVDIPTIPGCQFPGGARVSSRHRSGHAPYQGLPKRLLRAELQGGDTGYQLHVPGQSGVFVHT